MYTMYYIVYYENIVAKVRFVRLDFIETRTLSLMHMYVLCKAK